MEGSILELVLKTLRSAGIPAEKAYPGNRYAMIGEPVAAVHIANADQAARTVTVEVVIAVPASLGGTRCEEEALKAAAVLKRIRARCVQSGCEYVGATQVYTVSLMATFTGVTDNTGYEIGSGFTVSVNGLTLPYAVFFRGEQVRNNPVQRTMGTGAPLEIGMGDWVWEVEIQERIPGAFSLGYVETEPVTVTVDRDGMMETYTGCVWDTVRHEYSPEGFSRIRKGKATGKGDGNHGQAGV